MCGISDGVGARSIDSQPRPARLNVAEDALIAIQKNLFALKSFLDSNPQLFHSAPGDHAGARAANAPEQDAWRVSR